MFRPRSDASALAVVPIVSMEFSRCRADHHARLTVASESVIEDTLVSRIYVENCETVAPAGNDADGIGIGKLIRQLSTTAHSDVQIIPHHRLLGIGRARKRRESVLGINRLELSKQAAHLRLCDSESA